MAKDGKLISAGTLVQVYTRIPRKDADRLRKAAKRDERPVMTYLRRLIQSHLDSLEKED
jgi:predicted DNA-binding protein